MFPPGFLHKKKKQMKVPNKRCALTCGVFTWWFGALLPDTERERLGLSAPDREYHFPLRELIRSGRGTAARLRRLGLWLTVHSATDNVVAKPSQPMAKDVNVTVQDAALKEVLLVRNDVGFHGSCDGVQALDHWASRGSTHAGNGHPAPF